MDTLQMSTQEILSEIARYQSIQKQCAPTSDNWRDASDALSELFDEMQYRDDPLTDTAEGVRIALENGDLI